MNMVISSIDLGVEKDVYRQLFLLLNGLNEKEEDVSLAKDILREAKEQNYDNVLLIRYKLKYIRRTQKNLRAAKW